MLQGHSLPRLVSTSAPLLLAGEAALEDTEPADHRFEVARVRHLLAPPVTGGRREHRRRGVPLYAKLKKGECCEGEMIWQIPLFEFAFYTGMRASELSPLRWKHIDRDSFTF